MIRFKTAAAMTVLCAALGACADLTPRPQYPVSTPLPAPPPAPAPPAPAPAPVPKSTDDDAPQARPSTPVEQSTLPPPPGAKVAAPKRGSMLEPRYESGDDVLVFAAAAEDASVTVGQGDTLQKIAKKTGVSIDDLAKANKLQAPYKLKIGQTLALPAAELAPEPAAKAGKSKSAKAGAAKAAPKPPETTEVGQGDTLAKIARTAGVSVEDLAKANGLQPPYRLKVGQTLALSAPAEPDQVAATGSTKAEGRKAPAKAAATPTSVKVGKGDTLQTIADKAGVPVAELAKLNHLKKPYRVKRGQAIALPSDDQTEAPAPSSAPKAASSKRAAQVTVGKGDTLQSIADQAGVPVAELAMLNHLKKPYRVKHGQKISLPADEEADAAPSAPKAEAPRVVTAGRRDTLQSIADKDGVPVGELAKLNHLKKPYRIKRGQKIRLPGHAAAASSAASYQVKSGDTLYSIARRYGTDAKALADANGLDAGAQLNVGRRLQLPGGPLDRPASVRRQAEVAPPEAAPPARGREPAAPVPYSSLPANPPTASAPGLAPPPALPPASAPLTTQPYRPQPAPTPYRPTPVPAPDAAGPPAAADADVAAAGKGFFQWPLHGQTLSGYGPKTGGQRNDGLDIAAAAGEAVRAAAGGEVVYAGNSVPGFGNLVLIRHDGGWVTAYAHLANIDVKMRQTVTQGQQIGEAGQTGGVDQPQVHFEVRYAPSLKDKARPIDPMLVLPQ
jgi:LysM repeat protein